MTQRLTSKVDYSDIFHELVIEDCLMYHHDSLD